MPWLDKLIQLLCSLLEVLGGDCAELEDSSDPGAIIAEAQTLYNPQSPPEPANNTQRSEWCGLLAEIEGHLALPENSLSQAQDASLRAVVDSLQGDIEC